MKASGCEETRLRLYEYDNPVSAAKTVAQQGHSKIYLIWWVNGQGWYGQPTVPLSFEEVYHNDEIAIYLYEQSRTPRPLKEAHPQTSVFAFIILEARLSVFE